MSDTVTRTALDEMTCRCGLPGCEGSLYFHGRCHPEARTWTKYFDGVATVECAECQKPIIRLAVAS